MAREGFVDKRRNDSLAELPPGEWALWTSLAMPPVAHERSSLTLWSMGRQKEAQKWGGGGGGCGGWGREPEEGEVGGRNGGEEWGGSIVAADFPRGYRGQREAPGPSKELPEPEEAGGKGFLRGFSTHETTGNTQSCGMERTTVTQSSEHGGFRESPQRY